MPPLGVIVGPTASGKSELAMAIAARQPVEILVADSRQVYRGMDVGTAKPDAADRAAVPHDLLDLVSPEQPFSVADWLARARRLIPEVAERGRLPLVVGGTGLYVTALVDGYQLEGQPWAPETRTWLAAELQADGLEPLVRRLERLDPHAARTIDRRNPRRVLRALERVEAAGGEPVAPAATPYPGRVAMLGISRPRGVLETRIGARAAAMFAGGLVDEVQALLKAGHPLELSPLSGHGYREAARVLAGEWTVQRAVEVTARRTRQYAKRQMTWFRRDPRIVWLPAGDRPADAPAIVERALDLLRRMLSG